MGAGLKPDIIALAYFINDAEPMPHYGDNGWLTEHSAAWVVLTYRVNSVFRQFGEVPDWRHYYRNLYEPQAPGWLATQKALAGFRDRGQQDRRRLLVFNIPELRELKPYPFTDITDKVRKVVESAGRAVLRPAAGHRESLTPSTCG